ncbi:hypothetical protein MTO96_008945 [Rhipicephalus appendiculatus]
MSSSAKSTHEESSPKDKSIAASATASVTDGALGKPQACRSGQNGRSRPTKLGLQTEEKVQERRVQEDDVPRAAESKGAAAADVPAKPGDLAQATDLEPARPAASEDAKAMALMSLPGSSGHPASSPSDAAAPTTSTSKAKKSGHSLNALDRVAQHSCGAILSQGKFSA